jgi:uncharacterized membrane protein YhaH (DUF805 family)
MSWGDIFFGFRGRINRKTYWAGSFLVAIAGLVFNALLTYLATGNPIAPAVWERPAEQSNIWAPVWIAYFAFLAWPSTALAVKRLHDRNRPVWIWYAYYAASLVLTLIPLRHAAAGPVDATAQLLLLPPILFAGYIFFELGVLRGTPGINEHGPDTLPPGYHGGDYNFWSWMLAFEGRISRSKWWLGVFILTIAAVAILTAMGLLVTHLMSQHPEIEQNLSNPEWIESREAAPLILKLSLWMILPSLGLALICWSLIALGVKRLHDRGLSTWLILVVVLPFFGAVLSPALATRFELGEAAVRLALLLLAASAIWSVLQFGILNGEKGPNVHGPDPRAG